MDPLPSPMGYLQNWQKIGIKKVQAMVQEDDHKGTVIPQMRLEQMQKIMSAMAKLFTNHLMLKQVMNGKDISSDVLRTINNTVSDMIRDINCCCKMETLGQVFFQPQPSYKKRPAEQDQDD
eukprot:2481758-Ditylum_brightwellii.AAC.1